MQDKYTGLLGNLPHAQVGGEPKTMTRRKDKEKNQVTTLAGKEDSTDSTATRTTAKFTSCCESEFDEYTVDEMREPCTLSDNAYGFGRERWVKLARK